jgi:hypothetical protein
MDTKPSCVCVLIRLLRARPLDSFISFLMCGSTEKKVENHLDRPYKRKRNIYAYISLSWNINCVRFKYFMYKLFLISIDLGALAK